MSLEQSNPQTIQPGGTPIPAVAAGASSLATISGPKSERPMFETVYEGTYSSLGVRPGIHGNLEVRFLLKGGAENMNAAFVEVAERTYSLPNCPEPGFAGFTVAPVYESPDSGGADPGLDRIRAAERVNSSLPKNSDFVLVYTPVVDGTENRPYRYAPDVTAPVQSQADFLAQRGLEGVNTNVHLLACAMYRVHKGFPAPSDEAWEFKKDDGDLNQGKTVRTISPGGVGAVRSYDIGFRSNIDRFDTNPDTKSRRIFAAGAETAA